MKFENVSFAYFDDRPVLNAVSFIVPRRHSHRGNQVKLLRFLPRQSYQGREANIERHDGFTPVVSTFSTWNSRNRDRGYRVEHLCNAKRRLGPAVLDKGEQIRLPNMVYDPVLQMMVDPDTRQPVYSNGNGGKFRIATAVETSGCGNCPKNDGCKDNPGC